MAERNEVEEAVEGAVEGVKGKAKEVAGKWTGRADLHREGEAQQDKADAQRDAAKKEAEAESARGAAKANEKRQAAEHKVAAKGNGAQTHTDTNKPHRRGAVRNEIAAATTATAGAPYWTRTKPTGPGPI